MILKQYMKGFSEMIETHSVFMFYKKLCLRIQRTILFYCLALSPSVLTEKFVSAGLTLLPSCGCCHDSL